MTESVTVPRPDAPRSTRRAAAAVERQAQADRKRGLADAMLGLGDTTGARWERREAAQLDADARAALALPDDAPLIRGAGEVVCPPAADAGDTQTAEWFADTLKAPGLLAATASLDRLKLLLALDCTEIALDLEATLGPRNSIERALAHQLSAAHVVAMRLLARGTTLLQSGRPGHRPPETVESMRLVNSAALEPALKIGAVVANPRPPAPAAS